MFLSPARYLGALTKVETGRVARFSRTIYYTRGVDVLTLAG